MRQRRCAAAEGGPTVSLLQAISQVKLPFHDQRRSVRQNIQYPAWIDLRDGTPLYDCTVLDVSDNGVRLMLSVSIALPKYFHLVFNKEATRRRPCRLVWRLDNEIGLSYLGPLQYEPTP